MYFTAVATNAANLQRTASSTVTISRENMNNVSLEFNPLLTLAPINDDDEPEIIVK
jgi:hypothetical protein